MNRETTPYCAAFGFDGARIQEILSILGLNAQHGALAERLRAEVIAGKAGIDHTIERLSKLEKIG